MHKASWIWEQKLWDEGYKAIAGIDEVGRGAWAGPLVAGAFIFTSPPPNLIIFDSKQLTEKKRQIMAQKLFELGFYALGEVSAAEIDFLGLQEAQYTAYRRALASLPISADFVLLDGRPWRQCSLKHQAVVNGDRQIASVAAASVIAKVYRDEIMKKLAHRHFPEYGFNKHVGYGTQSHREAIQKIGPTPIHRYSFEPIRSLRA